MVLRLRIKPLIIIIAVGLIASSSRSLANSEPEPESEDSENDVGTEPDKIITDNNQDMETQLQDPDSLSLDSQPTFADIPDSLYDSYRDNDSGNSHYNSSENSSGIPDNDGNTTTLIDAILGLNSTTNETLITNTTKPPKILISCVPYVPKEYRILVPIEQSVNLNETSIPDTTSTNVTNSTEEEESDSGSEPEVQFEEQILDYIPTVEIVNVTKLNQEVLWSNSSIKSRSTPANCSIVLFYASWCRYSANAAAHYNALPRAFPSLRVSAIDSYKYKSVTSYYGILAVPTILLFHNGKAVARFNGTSFTLHRFAEFVEGYSELKSVENISVTSQDFLGPLPSTITEEVDIWLVLAWIFIILCFLYYISNSTLWKKIVELILSTWREAEDQQQQPEPHEHAD